MSEYTEIEPDDILGGCTGVRFLPPGAGNKCIQLMIEDDGNWFLKDFVISSYWIEDMITVLEKARRERDSRK